MASTFSDLLRYEKMAKGDQNGTWGATFNNQLEMIEDAVAGVAVVAHPDTASYTLSALNGISDEARRMVLKITGTLTATRQIIVPSSTKLYAVHNATVGGFSIDIKTSGGTAARVASATAVLVYIGTDGNATMVGGLDIASLAEKTTPVDADTLAIADSAASNGVRKLTFANLAAWIGAKLGPLVAAATAKTTIAEADTFLISDSAATGTTKKVTFTTLKAELATVSTSAPSGGADGDVWYQV